MQVVSVHADTQDALDVVLRGEVDFTNAGTVMAAVQSALRRHRPTTIRVEMTEVTFLDSSGIGVLVSVMRAAEGIGAAYRVDHPNPNVLDQLRLAGLLDVFGVSAAPAGDDLAAEPGDRVG